MATTTPQEGYMSDEPDPVEGQEPEPAGDRAPDPESKGGRKAPWNEENFDAEKAAKLLENLTGDLNAVRQRNEELASKVKEHEDASKSDQEKLEERAAQAEGKLGPLQGEVLRLRVALRKGLTETQAKRLIGDSEEDIEKDADELLASFARSDDEDPPRRPRERLRPGAVPDAEPEPNDPAELAKQVTRSW